MDVIKPQEKGLSQIHTNGEFLEKPGLLQKAMKSMKEWDSQVPGSEDIALPKVAKRMTTVENALLRLKEEKEFYSTVGSQFEDNIDSEMQLENNNDGDVILNDYSSNVIDSNLDDKDEDRFSFEEHSSSSSEKKDEISDDDEVSANVGAPRLADDPVVVFIRHGRTPHNKLALFTGWEDPPLAIEGEEDAKWAGRLLKKHGFEFDVVYTSWLYRAIQTAWFVLEEMDQLYLPMIKSWRLNERHYGSLTGKRYEITNDNHYTVTQAL